MNITYAEYTHSADVYCKKCGKPIYHVGDTPVDLCQCDAEETKAPAPMVGWICPVCGNGLAPWVSVCPNPHTVITSGDASTVTLASVVNYRGANIGKHAWFPKLKGQLE